MDFSCYSNGVVLTGLGIFFPRKSIFFFVGKKYLDIHWRPADIRTFMEQLRLLVNLGKEFRVKCASFGGSGKFSQTLNSLPCKTP